MAFRASPEFSVGLELEFQLLDASTLDLSDAIVPVMKLFPDTPHVKPEFIQDSVEVTSDVCRGTADLQRDLHQRVGDLLQGCASLGLRLAGAGTHAFGRRVALITPTPRYRALEVRSGGGYHSHTQVAFATHVHLGVPDGAEAIRVMRDLKPYVPVLIVLAANSPFWRAADTGFASYRRRILAASRSYGQPPDFNDWSEFEAAVALLERAGAIERARDLHWDLRPKPEFGTVEVRAMDAQTTVGQAVELAAFVRALVLHLRANRNSASKRLLQPLPWWIHKDNCFSAESLGRDASLVVEPGGTTMPVRHVLVHLFERLAVEAETLGERRFLDRLQQRYESGSLGYERQRALFRAQHSLVSVVEDLAATLETESAEATAGDN